MRTWTETIENHWTEIIGCILRSHNIRSTFYTEKTLRKLLWNPKDRVAAEDKNNIVYEIACSNCEGKGEAKRSLKSRSDEDKRSVRNCHCDKNEIAKQCWETDHHFNWDQKKVIDRESRLIPRKIKETINSLKNPLHINKISYMLPKIWHLIYGSSELLIYVTSVSSR